MNGWGFEQVNGFAKATPWLHAVIVGYANYGVLLFVGLFVAGWWTARRSGQVAPMAAVVCAVAATLLAIAVNQPIVAAAHEARPYATHAGILVLAHRGTDFSFPSDHAVMAGAAAAGLWFVSRRLAIVAIFAALVMAFARVYIAAHYPQDVVAGLLLGAAIAIVVYLAGRGVAARLITAAARTRLQPLLRAAPVDDAEPRFGR
jgi:membrane-associated phospholipid phosphatase